MKHIIKKILKEESLKHNFKQQIKDYGWEATAELVNGPEELAKLAFDNDPMEFLHMFDDMDAFQSENIPNSTLFKPKNQHHVMIHDRKRKLVFIDDIDITSFLKDGFGLSDYEVLNLTSRWVDEVYDLRGVTMGTFSFMHVDRPWRYDTN